jgi:hypothetical protein
MEIMSLCKKHIPASIIDNCCPYCELEKAKRKQKIKCPKCQSIVKRHITAGYEGCCTDFQRYDRDMSCSHDAYVIVSLLFGKIKYGGQ